MTRHLRTTPGPVSFLQSHVTYGWYLNLGIFRHASGSQKNSKRFFHDFLFFVVPFPNPFFNLFFFGERPSNFIQNDNDRIFSAKKTFTAGWFDAKCAFVLLFQTWARSEVRTTWGVTKNWPWLWRRFFFAAQKKWCFSFAFEEVPLRIYPTIQRWESKNPKREPYAVQVSHEKNHRTFHYTGWLMTGSLFHGLWNNPYKTE